MELKRYCLKVSAPISALCSLVRNLKDKYKRERKRMKIYRWFTCTRNKNMIDSGRPTECEIQEEPKKDGNGIQEVVENSAPARNETENRPTDIAVPALSLHELIQLTDNFGLRTLVGEGSHARVYYAVLNSKGVAIKKLDMPQKPETNTDFTSQLSFVSKLKHRNFVQLLGYYVEGNLRLLAYEFATMGSLHDVLHGRKGGLGTQPSLPLLEWDKRVRIAYDVAIEYLHEKVHPPVVHKNIKSTNILIFQDHRAKIADFDLLNQAPDMAARLLSTRVLGTFGYHAPE